MDIDKGGEAALLHAKYTGSRNFIVTNYDPDGNQIDLLINTIGQYDGTRPLDFMADEHTSRIQVESSGSWEIQILPLTQIRIVHLPGTFTGNGDDVVLLGGSGTPDLMKVDAKDAKHNFIIHGYGDRYDLLVNEIAPYEGTVILGKGIFILGIQAMGNWSIDVTTK